MFAFNLFIQWIVLLLENPYWLLGIKLAGPNQLFMFIDVIFLFAACNIPQPTVLIII